MNKMEILQDEFGNKTQLCRTILESIAQGKQVVPIVAKNGLTDLDKFEEILDKMARE